MKKSIIVTLLMTATLLTAGIAMAKYHGSGSGNCNGQGTGMMNEEQQQQRADERLERMAIILDLSDNQQEQIKVLQNKHRQERQGLRDEMREGRNERRAAMSNDNFDEAALRSNLAKQAEFKADRMVERAQMKQELYAILTPEQQEKAETLWESRGRKGGGKHAKGLNF